MFISFLWRVFVWGVSGKGGFCPGVYVCGVFVWGFFVLIPFYLYSRVKRYLPLLKMAEELIGNLGYGAPQSDTKRQKLLECVLTGNSKLYLGKVYTKEQLENLVKKKWKNFLIIMKLSYQVKW